MRFSSTSIINYIKTPTEIKLLLFDWRIFCESKIIFGEESLLLRTGWKIWASDRVWAGEDFLILGFFVYKDKITRYLRW